MENRFVPYYRVSTERQGRSGLGLEAQQADAQRLIAVRGGVMLRDYTEIETGKNPDRPQLAAAIQHAKMSNATLVVAKLDRLARNLAFISALMESNVDFVCCDCPTADRLHIHILAAIAEHEARMISRRTKDALAVAKARGTKLGSAREGAWVGREHLRGFKKASARAAVVRRRATEAKYAFLIPVLKEQRMQGRTFEEIAAWLTANGHRTPSGQMYSKSRLYQLLQRHAPECTGQRPKFGVLEPVLA